MTKSLKINFRLFAISAWLKMFLCQGGCHPLPRRTAAVQILPAVFGKQHVQQEKLGKLCRDGAELKRAFVRTAAQNQIRIFRPR